MEGEAEADRVKSFITGLSGVVDTETAVDLFKTMRKVDVMARLSEGTKVCVWLCGRVAVCSLCKCLPTRSSTHVLYTQ